MNAQPWCQKEESVLTEKDLKELQKTYFGK